MNCVLLLSIIWILYLILNTYTEILSIKINDWNYYIENHNLIIDSNNLNLKEVFVKEIQIDNFEANERIIFKIQLEKSNIK